MVRQPGHPPARVAILALVGLVLCIAIGLVVWQVGRRQEPTPAAAIEFDSQTVTAAPSADVQRQVEAFCSDCHALPRPESFPRDRWHYEVKKGYEFYARTGRNDLQPPPLYQAVAYYRSQAPEQPEFPRPPEADQPLKTTFQVTQMTLDASVGILPEIACLRWTRLDPETAPVLLACDMRYGQITAVGFEQRRTRLQVLARLGNPCHVEPCDLDGDGVTDLVVTDLGSYLPSDHDRGSVVLLRRHGDQQVQAIPIATGLSRPADVRPADFDLDGDLDLVVAEFGWYRTGRILYLENVSPNRQEVRFEIHEVDGRPGTIHVPVHDFDQDGRPDFVALVSQEYESVEVFLNRGRAAFQRFPIWSGPDLTFGSSGLELVDLDQDGDQDILTTNGDAWDNDFASPLHGIQWLENRGNLEFVYHRLVDMPGAYRALAGDIDLDGDQDIIATAWLPPKVQPASLKVAESASIICLEQTQPGVFVHHTLETGSPFYAAMALADFDQDGDLDFAVPSGPLVANARKDRHWLSVWWNQAVPDAASR